METKTITEQLIDWKTGWNGKITVFGVVTVIFIILLVLLFSVANMAEIAKNFPRYRCNPLMMPFVGSFGYDPKENFNFCLGNIFNVKAAEIFAPIYAILGNFTQIVQMIMNVALSIRQLFSSFLAGVNNFIRNVRDRVQTLLFSIRMSFLKMNNLMGKVYGTMYAVMWMGTSALTAGQSLGDSELVKFLFEFCFHPDTQIQRADGSYTKLSNIQIGDTLAPLADNSKPVVTSVFKFDGTKTPMVTIGDVMVSCSHYVEYNQTMIHAEDHPLAKPVLPTSSLICLNVSGHRFAIGRNALIVADYDEHEGDSVKQKTQAIAMTALNGRTDTSRYVADYSLGIDSSYTVRCSDGSWRPISNIRLGDTVWNAGKVLGIVQEQGDIYVSDNDGIRMSAAQIRFNPKTKLWERVAETAKKESLSVLYSLITERCGTIHVRLGNKEHFIRDYREVPLPEMEAAYDEILTS
jgi:hypothetical protein